MTGDSPARKAELLVISTRPSLVVSTAVPEQTRLGLAVTDNLDQYRSPDTRPLVAALKAVLQNHHPRSISSRTNDCWSLHDEEEREVWCTEDCFEDVDICNGCGSQGECRYQLAVARELGVPLEVIDEEEL
jgi:hypothetical protein